MGNVRDYGYDFARVWRSPRADEFRRSVRAKECACPLANASYTNLLLDAPSLAKVSASMLGVRLPSSGPLARFARSSNLGKPGP
jgi:hypothetical protein